MDKIIRPTELEKFIEDLTKKRYKELAILEEELWRQRAKLRWNLEGDRKTRYFHAMASGHKRRNVIPQIEINGTMFSDQKSKGEAFFNYYKDLMGKQSPQTPPIH